jgi:hypothetical protein
MRPLVFIRFVEGHHHNAHHSSITSPFHPVHMHQVLCSRDVCRQHRLDRNAGRTRSALASAHAPSILINNVRSSYPAAAQRSHRWRRTRTDARSHGCPLAYDHGCQYLRESATRRSWSDVRPHGSRGARTVLRGFTTVRDMAGPAFRIKAAIDAKGIPGPRVYPTEVDHLTSRQVPIL